MADCHLPLSLPLFVSLIVSSLGVILVNGQVILISTFPFIFHRSIEMSVVSITEKGKNFREKKMTIGSG